MAKRPLKVFRTAIGFHDAYVAATSRKAALEAWGAGTDLFASGAAELVTDAKLTGPALEQPGTVIRVARGTTAEHLAAAGTARPKGRTSGRRQAPPEPPAKAAPRKKPPKPSRAALDEVETALRSKEAAFSASIAEFDAKIEALRRERDALRRQRDDELRALEQRRSQEEEAYRRALDEWEA